jgi:hypothetical protein
MVKLVRGSFVLKITQAMHKKRARLGKLTAHENVLGRRRKVMRKRRGVPRSENAQAKVPFPSVLEA